MRYLIPKEVAEKWGIPVRRVQILCKQGKIKGAECHGRIWLIPETAEKARGCFFLAQSTLRDSSQATSDGKNCSSRQQSYIYSCRCGLWQNHPHDAVCRWTERCGLAFLDERDSNMTYFLRHLEDAFRKKFPRFDFYATDLLPFAARDTFVSRALSALLCAIGRRKLTLILDDVHVITNGATMDFLNRLVKSCPSSLTLVMAGRYELWERTFPAQDGRTDCRTHQGWSVL